MRVLYLGNFEQAWNTESYVARAFKRIGHAVHRLNEAETSEQVLGNAIRETQPDLFLFAKGRLNGNFDPAVAGVRRCLHEFGHLCRNKACWVFDLLRPEFSRERWTWARSVNECVDVFFMTDGYSAEQLNRAVVLRQGVPDDFRPGVWQAAYDAPAAFLGGAYGPRKAFLDRIATEVKNRLGKAILHVPEGVRGAALSDLMASVTCVIGPDYPAYPSYWSNRLYVVTGYGGLFLGPEVVGMSQEGWVPWVHYWPFNPADPWDALEQVLRANVEPEAARRIAAAGTALCRERFTYDRRVQELLERLR